MDGTPIEKNMQPRADDLEDIAEATRQQQIAHLDDVQWAVMETSGAISFIKKSGSS